MQKIDHKIIIKSYEYFSKNAQLFLRSRSLQHDLKIEDSTLNKAIERLEKLGYIEFNNQTSAGSPYQLSEKGVSYAQQNTISFLEKIYSNKIANGLFRVILFILVYLLGLYTDEIKAFLNKLF